MSITIYGAGADMLELSGDINEEFAVLDHEHGTLTFSDGTVIRYDLTDEDDGTWRFKVEKTVASAVTIDPASERRRPTYSDHCLIGNDGITWVRCDALPADANTYQR